jgi:dipeptidase E
MLLTRKISRRTRQSPPNQAHLTPLFSEITHKGFREEKLENPRASPSALKYMRHTITCMTKLYFLGGENVTKRDSSKINEAAFNDAGGAPVVVVFPWARASFDNTYKRRKRLFDYFRSLGACDVDFIDYSDTYEEINRKVEGSDLIYLPGGLASVLVERLKNKNVDQLLRDYDGVVVGRSAGALALGKKCVVTRNRRNPTSKLIRGIGLVGFSVKAHYKPSKDLALRNLSRDEKIYAVPERSALVYDEGCISIMGDVYLFQNGEKVRVG